MAKRGGTKRALPMEKITKKETLRTCHTKRTNGLFSKASQLCLLSPDSHMAILATPCSSDSTASFFSFGHSSVDTVVSAFLSGQPPVHAPAPKGVGREGFWWEDERLHKSEDPDELKAAMDSILILMKQAKELEANHLKKKSQLALQATFQDPDQTLNLKSTCTDPENLNKSHLVLQQHPTQVDDVLPESFVNHQAKNSVVEPVQTLNNLESNDGLTPEILAICESFKLTERNLDKELDDICELIDFDTTTTSEEYSQFNDWAYEIAGRNF